MATLFNSYAHSDTSETERLLALLTPNLKACGLTNADIWIDRQIFVGEKWDSRIKAKLTESSGGLLMLSPAAIGSDYIRSVEIPYLIEKKLIPVALKLFDFDSQLPPELKPRQVFRHRTNGGNEICFSQCHGKAQQEAFAFALYQKIRDLLL